MRERIIDLLNHYADLHGVDRRYVHAIARIESGHRQLDNRGNVLTSRAGALGVMQLMPRTAQGLGVNPLVLEENIEGGVRYFRQRLELAGGDVPTAIAMYYAGIGNVRDRGALHWEGVQRYIRNFFALIQNPDIVNMAEREAPAPPQPQAPAPAPFLPVPTPQANHTLLIVVGAVLVVVIVSSIFGR